MDHKAGFVNIIGLPNVGKSTLMNALIGERLSIISPKAQTTRHRILGMVNNDNYQIVFGDTPGFINQPAYKLQTSMNSFVGEALQDADLVLFVTDMYQSDVDQAHLVELVRKSKVPALVLINKQDLMQPDELDSLVKFWKDTLPEATAIMPISAASGISRKKLLNKMVELLPVSPAYYDKDQLTDRNTRFFVAEIVREQIFLNYTAEIPYSCQVEVETYKEEEGIDRIRCIIYVERESQKVIVIGKAGAALKKVGTDARKGMEDLLQKKVFLELFVKVKDKWRNDPLSLKNFGYDE